MAILGLTDEECASVLPLRPAQGRPKPPQRHPLLSESAPRGEICPSTMAATQPSAILRCGNAVLGSGVPSPTLRSVRTRRSSSTGLSSRPIGRQAAQEFEEGTGRSRGSQLHVAGDDVGRPPLHALPRRNQMLAEGSADPRCLGRPGTSVRDLIARASSLRVA